MYRLCTRLHPSLEAMIQEADELLCQKKRAATACVFLNRICLLMPNPPFDFAHENYPLAPLTRYRVGGPARWALFPETTEDVLACYEWLKTQSCKRMALGGGSNVLISDEGYDGVVLVTTHLTTMESIGEHQYCVGAGVELDDLVQNVMLTNNYDGVGGLTGIPGSVGGAMFMNAGTVNGSVCQLLESVKVVGSDGIKTETIDESCYSYRGQNFCKPGELITEGLFTFTPTEEEQQAIYDHYMERRRTKQPQGYCCGSVFKNPEGDHAGRLIEACDLKGTRHGGAIVSSMHANFILNQDGASFDDIMALITLCQTTVKEKFNVTLEPEVRIISS